MVMRKSGIDAFETPPPWPTAVVATDLASLNEKESIWNWSM